MRSRQLGGTQDDLLQRWCVFWPILQLTQCLKERGETWVCGEIKDGGNLSTECIHGGLLGSLEDGPHGQLSQRVRWALIV